MNFRFWRRNRRDEELAEEIQSHLQMAAREHVERGGSVCEAERRQMGNVGNPGEW